MKTWKIALVSGILAATVFVPVAPEIRQAEMPRSEPVAMAKIDVDKVTHAAPAGLSRSPVTAFQTAQKPLRGITILIDPGHGGQAKWSKVYYCGGTIGKSTGQTESDVNLRVSLCLRQYLEAAGATVHLTRKTDDRCTNGGTKAEELDFRSNMANHKGADLFISVHHNEGPKPDTNYTAVFYPSGKSGSVSLAENISSAVSRYLGTQNVGAKPGSYRVLSKINMPGVIVEASFMSNPTEDRRLQSLSYNKMEAKAIATGILNYFRITKGRQVDFNTIFSPIDDQAHTAQGIADATFIRRQIIEKRSLFGVKYEEVTYDGSGKITSVRPVGAGSLAAAQSKSSNSSVKIASASKSKKSSSKSKSKKTSTKTKKVTVKTKK